MRKTEYETAMFGNGLLESVRNKTRSHDSSTHQSTLAAAVDINGVGLHSGEMIVMTLRPAAANSGVVFRRTDLASKDTKITDIPATYAHVVETVMSTVIGNEAGTRVGTIEHLMAALSALRVDNVLVEISGAEVPVLDGSSVIFVEKIAKVGLVALDAPRKAIRVLKPVTVQDGLKKASLLPGDSFKLAFEIEFDNPVIGHQEVEADLYDDFFVDDILHARTFGFYSDFEKLQAAGLARGASLENAVVIDGERILNEDGLRCEDEFVRHKVLDAVGDLSLSGLPLIGRYEGVRSGHAMNNLVLRALFADASAWEVVDFALPVAARHKAAPQPVALPAE